MEKVKSLSNSQRLIHMICAGKLEVFELLFWRRNGDGEQKGLK